MSQPNHEPTASLPTDLTDPAETADTPALDESAEVTDDVFDVLADDVLAQCRDRGDHHVVAPADGEAQRVPFRALGVCADYGVGRRVVGIRVHRVRPVVLERGGEADVIAVERDDSGTGPTDRDGGRRRDRGGFVWLHMRHLRS